MIYGEALKMAIASLWRNKGRSALTILGVVIGVSSVLAVTSLGSALEASLDSSLNSEEDRSVYVTANTGSAAGPGGPNAGQFGLIFTEVDRQALLDLPNVETVVAGGEVAVTSLQFGTKEAIPWRTISATISDDPNIKADDLYDDGEVFQDGRKDVVLGALLAEKLGGPDAGDEITMVLGDGDELIVTVAGILLEQEDIFFDLGGNVNNGIYVPIDPFYSASIKSPSTEKSVLVYTGFTVIADDIREVQSVKAAVREYLDEDSDANELLQEDVEILVADAGDIQEEISGALAQVTAFIAAIAAVSLLVGGIMIGTIMLITVTERTKEIGMMKAIGAYNSEILRLFLLEAVVIGFVGSLVGIIFGIVLGYLLVTSLFAGDGSDIQFAVPWAWIGYSVIVGVATGAIAGYFPARRATKIEPVEALSYE